MLNVQSSLLSPSRTGRGATNGSSLVIPAEPRIGQKPKASTGNPTPEVSARPGLRLCSYCTSNVLKKECIVEGEAASDCISCELLESASPSNRFQDAAEGIQKRDLVPIRSSPYRRVAMFDSESARLQASLVNMSITYYLCRK
jgi:hypothetical protein